MHLVDATLLGLAAALIIGASAWGLSSSARREVARREACLTDDGAVVTEAGGWHCVRGAFAPGEP